MAYLSRKNFGVVASTSSLGSGISWSSRPYSSLLFPSPVLAPYGGYCIAFSCIASVISCQHDLVSAPDEIWRPFGVEGLDPLLEILRLAQPAVAMAFQFDRNGQRGVFRIVQKLLRR